MKIMIRTYVVDGDSVEITYTYDESRNRYFGEFPDFEVSPRYTSEGRPWVNVLSTGCEFAEGEYDDCGSCRHILRQRPKDLIGVCQCDSLKR